MRQLNLVFLAGLVLVLAVLGGSGYFLHAYQVQRNASVLLDRARRAEEDKDLGRAAESLSRYLSIKRQDGPTWAWYARVVDQQAPEGPGRAQVYLIHEQALGFNPGDPQLERKCAELALELQRFSDARRHLRALLPEDSPGKPADAILEDLLGQCARGEAKFAEAEDWFRKAIAHGPGQADTYDRLARMLRTELRKPDEADQLIESMVKANPKSARAYLNRWRYRTEFQPPADPRDVQQALQLGPDDPDVLLAAAVVSEQKRDLAAAREHLRKGLKLAPKSTAFPILLAQLELRDGHPDRAETVLREAAKANPNRELWYLLADVLISEGKIDGEDQAVDYINRLRNSGLSEGYVQLLEARTSFQRQRWSEAVSKFNRARALLAADPQSLGRLNLMLAECYGRLGQDDQRLAALQRASGDETTGAAARLALAQELARSGKLDEAVKVYLQLVDRRPESWLDMVRHLIRKVLRQPRDRRDWQEVERRLQQAEKALHEPAEELTLLRSELLTAQGRTEEARTLVEAARTKDPRNARYRVALASIAQVQGHAALATQILDQAEKDLGPNLDLRLARLSSWVSRGGTEARAAIAELAKTRTQLPAADQPQYLEPLAQAAYRLGELALARQSLRELLDLQSDNLQVMMELYDLALEANDLKEASEVATSMHRVEGEEGTHWRYGQALYLISLARRGDTKGLETAQALASEIAARRGDWWGGPLLRAEIAELRGDLDAAVADYLRAVELGSSQPSLARRLVGLLTQRQEFDQVDRVVQTFRDRGVALEDLTSVMALNAIRKKDFERGVALARQAFPETSTRATDHLSLGQLLLAAGRTEEAGRELRRAVELGPDLAEAWLAYVQYLVQAKQLDQAKAAVEAAGKALPADRSTATLAQCFALVGDANQAETLFQKALAAQPGDPATLRLAATFYVDQKRNDQAQALLTRLVDPKTGASPADAAWANRTRGLMGLGGGRLAGIDQALGLIEQNLKANPNDFDDRRLRAILLSVRTSKRKDAIDQLEALDRSHRLGPDDRFLLAYLYNAEGEQDRYRIEMLTILAGKEKNPRYLAHFIGFLIGRNEIDQAGRWLAELKRLEPDGLAAFELEARMLKAGKRDQDLLAFLQARARQHPDQIGAVARLLDLFGFARQAEEAYRADIARAPKGPELVLALAGFLIRQARIDEAIEILKKAWTTCTPERVALVALGIYNMPSANESQKTQVETWLVEAIQRRPEAAGLVPKLAVIRFQQGRFDEAETLLRQTVASDPENPEALNGLAWVLSHRDPSKLQEALELINRAIGVAGEDPARLDTRAVIFLHLGQPDPALQDLGKSLALRPSSRDSYFHLARAHLMAGNHASSRTAFLRAEKLGLKPETVDPLEREAYQKLRQELDLR
jgi:predicted Zn-dependent protease